MTVYEFLLKSDIDIKDNKNILGNHLEGELALKGVIIDFSKDIEDISENELLEIGRILILSENKGKPFWTNELLEFMKRIIEKQKNV
ncbi:MAG: hypothetical protein ACI8ZM_000534 [Crocinitomix sp.]|jgi:hypothetical protein